MAPSETSHRKQDPCSPENHGVRQPRSGIVPARDACPLYIIKAGEVSGPCSAFGGKSVILAGYCAAYMKMPEPVTP
jgi:hypothetical protein